MGGRWRTRGEDGAGTWDYKCRRGYGPAVLTVNTQQERVRQGQTERERVSVLEPLPPSFGVGLDDTGGRPPRKVETSTPWFLELRVRTEKRKRGGK